MSNQNNYAELTLFTAKTTTGDSSVISTERMKEGTFAFTCTGGTATIITKGKIGSTWYDVDEKDMTSGTSYSFPFAIGAFTEMKANISAISGATINGAAAVHTK